MNQSDGTGIFDYVTVENIIPKDLDDWLDKFK